MKSLLRAAVSLIVPLAIFASAANAATSGDTCSAAGNGSTTYTVSIDIPADAPTQSSFALRASGANVTAITSTVHGSFSTQNLPADTSAAWVLSTAAIPGGPIVLDVTTNSKVVGSFTIIPSGFPDISCGVSVGTPGPSAAFTTQHTATYDASARDWRLSVTVPRGGTIRSVQQVLSNQVQPDVKRSVEGAKLTVKTGGTHTLVLKLTGVGKTRLMSLRTIAVKLSITFSPTVGLPVSRIVYLTLHR